jgi:hypothetical protein
MRSRFQPFQPTCLFERPKCVALLEMFLPFDHGWCFPKLKYIKGDFIPMPSFCVFIFSFDRPMTFGGIGFLLLGGVAPPTAYSCQLALPRAHRPATPNTGANDFGQTGQTVIFLAMWRARQVKSATVDLI